MHALNVFGVLRRELSSGMRSAATQGRGRARCRRVADRSTWRRRGRSREDENDVRPVLAREGRQRRRDPATSLLPPRCRALDPLRRALRHPVDEASVRRGSLQEAAVDWSVQKQKAAPQNVSTGSSGTGPAHERPRATDHDEESRRDHGPRQDHPGEKPRPAPRREPVTDRSAQRPRPGARCSAPDVRLEDAVVERWPP